jgi:hypothetical protein
MAKGLRGPIYVNGNAYGWSSLLVNFSIIAGPIYGIKEINFSQNQVGEPIYGASTMPIALGFGRFENSGNIVLYQDTFTALIKAAKDLGYEYIMDMPSFTITLTFKAPADDTKFSVIRINNCNIMNMEIVSSEGTLANEVNIPILFSDIEYVF